VEQLRGGVTAGDDMSRAMSVLLRKLSGFSGLVHENMYHFSGWHFLSIGRALERAYGTAALLARFADPDAPEGSLDLAVEVGDSVMTHRRRYAVATNRATVVDLLALDPMNPRAVIYQLKEIAGHISHLPGAEPHRQLSPLQRAMLKLEAGVAVCVPDSLGTAELDGFCGEIADLSERIEAAYFR